MTVVPFTEPPVGTRGRPLAIFFVLSMLGSSQLPKAGDVVEKALVVVGRHVESMAFKEAWVGVWSRRKDDAPPNLSPWRALASASVLGGAIVPDCSRREGRFDGRLRLATLKPCMDEILWSLLVEYPEATMTKPA